MYRTIRNLLKLGRTDSILTVHFAWYKLTRPTANMNEKWFSTYFILLNKQPFELGLENSSASKCGWSFNLAFLNNQGITIQKWQKIIKEIKIISVCKKVCNCSRTCIHLKTVKALNQLQINQLFITRDFPDLIPMAAFAWVYSPISKYVYVFILVN